MNHIESPNVCLHPVAFASKILSWGGGGGEGFVRVGPEGAGICV